MKEADTGWWESFEFVVNRIVCFNPCFHKRRTTVNYVGIDLHKKTISICVVNQERQKINYKRFACSAPQTIVYYCRRLGWPHPVVEATATSQCLRTLVEACA